MRLHVDDDGFVRAPKGLVYRRLTDLASWPDFWPGADLVPASAAQDGSARFGVTLQPRHGPRVRFEAHPHGWRHDEGFRLVLAGDVEGEAEFWLEEGWGGTVVHHLASLAIAGRRPRRIGAAYRSALRRGFGGLKDDLQGEVRERLGLTR